MRSILKGSVDQSVVLSQPERVCQSIGFGVTVYQSINFAICFSITFKFTKSKSIRICKPLTESI